MKTISTIFLPLKNEVTLAFGPTAGNGMMHELLAKLAQSGLVYLIDCNTRSNPTRIADYLINTYDPVAYLRNIKGSRAFTCYMVVARIEEFIPEPGVPVLILDLLHTFLDEKVKIKEATRLFAKVLQRLTLISQVSPVVISAKPLPQVSAPRLTMLDDLVKQAAQVWREPPSLTPKRRTRYPGRK